MNLLPPATKLGQGYVFTGVWDSVHGGEYLTRYTSPWDQVHPLGPGTPPGTRYTPGPGTLPRPGTPLTRYTPWTRYTPRTRYTPQDQVHPLDQVHPPRTRYTPLKPDTPPRPGTPPRDQVHSRCRACWEVRSTRGRYASYWNAILWYIFSNSPSICCQVWLHHNLSAEPLTTIFEVETLYIL